MNLEKLSSQRDQALSIMWEAAPSRLWIHRKVQMGFLRLPLTVQNVEIRMRFGGCYRRDLLTKQQHNFIDALNVDIPGGIIRDLRGRTKISSLHDI